MAVRSLQSTLSIADPDFLRLRGPAALAFLVAGCVSIIGWQALFMQHASDLDATYRNNPGLYGYHEGKTSRFFYFLYYTGNFPIATKRPLDSPAFDRDVAHQYLRVHPGLVNELGVYLRTGDLAKIFLLYPSAWWNGTPQDATLMEFNRLFGVVPLLALFLSFSLLDHRMLGVVLVALIGSNPFQLHSLYATDNVFGYSTAFACLMLALHAPLVLGRARGLGAIAIAIASGVLIATMREVRSEPALVIAPVAATYLLALGIGWRRRLVLLAVLALALGGTARAWSQYWDASFLESQRIVRAAGGVTFDAPRNRHHVLWHSLWCGLGDFGRSRGYAWDDRKAFRWAIPEVNRRYGTSYRYSYVKGRYHLDNFHTPALNYRIRPETLDEYNIVVRDRVLSDVLGDPLWYATILAKRAHVVLSETTPIRLGIGDRYVDLPFSGWIFIPVALFVLVLRRIPELLLMGFMLPMSLATILVYSAGGAGHTSMYHLMTFAILLAWGVNGVARLFPGRERGNAGEREAARKIG